MPILKSNVKDNFTIIPNNILYNNNVSLKTIGLYSKLLSLPDNWKFTEAGLCTIIKDGRDALRNALSELEELGYLFRFQKRQDGGKTR